MGDSTAAPRSGARVPSDDPAPCDATPRGPDGEPVTVRDPADAAVRALIDAGAPASDTLQTRRDRPARRHRPAPEAAAPAPEAGDEVTAYRPATGHRWLKDGPRPRRAAAAPTRTAPGDALAGPAAAAVAAAAERPGLLEEETRPIPKITPALVPAAAQDTLATQRTGGAPDRPARRDRWRIAAAACTAVLVVAIGAAVASTVGYTPIRRGLPSVLQMSPKPEAPSRKPSAPASAEPREAAPGTPGASRPAPSAPATPSAGATTAKPSAKAPKKKAKPKAKASATSAQRTRPTQKPAPAPTKAPASSPTPSPPPPATPTPAATP
ncbi:hypothetical protein [Actinomadura parmotrematis]|uniref:Uncharacterized protein n=1 Tax=Actinomadura parmotrematis TaxID=2864039 RepID=A0ABS7FPP4_9ACTN|nr:hypothetical protein [Actinomadura parmotrematis]MBW8481965.1 hypothetical protein [Actinomadura parmotrematis]